MSKRYLRIHYDDKQRPYITHNNKKVYITKDNKKEIQKYIKKHPNRIIKKKINKDKNKKNVKIMDKLIDYVLRERKRKERKHKTQKKTKINKLQESLNVMSGVASNEAKKTLNEINLKQIEIDDILKKYNLEIKEDGVKQKKGLPALEYGRIGANDYEKLMQIRDEIEELKNEKELFIQEKKIMTKYQKEKDDEIKNQRIKFKKEINEQQNVFNQGKQLYEKLEIDKKKIEENLLINQKNIANQKKKYSEILEISKKNKELLKKNNELENLDRQEKNKIKSKIIDNIMYDNKNRDGYIKELNTFLKNSGYDIKSHVEAGLNDYEIYSEWKSEIMDMMDKNAEQKKLKYKPVIEQYNKMFEQTSENLEKGFKTSQNKLHRDKYKRELEKIKETDKEIKESLKKIDKIRDDYIKNDFIIKENEKLIYIEEENKGNGLNNDDGLTIEQVDYVMTKYKKYLGTYLDSEIDEMINKIINNKILRCGAIILIHEHFIALYIDLRNELTIELYDPLGIITEKTEKFKYFVDKLYNKLQKMINKMNIDYLIKFKQNYIQQESQNSSLCGIYCINFLIKRFNNESWQKLTSYKNVSKSEKEMLKKRIQYGFI